MKFISLSILFLGYNLHSFGLSGSPSSSYSKIRKIYRRGKKKHSNRPFGKISGSYQNIVLFSFRPQILVTRIHSLDTRSLASRRLENFSEQPYTYVNTLSSWNWYLLSSFLKGGDLLHDLDVFLRFNILYF